MGSVKGHGKRAEESPAPPQLHPDRDPGNPALHSRFVELSEAYQVLSREQSRRSYDHQLCSAAPPKSPGATAHPGSAHGAHRYSRPAPACPTPRVSWGASSPHFLSSPSQQLLGTPQCTVLGPVSWCEASGTGVEAAAAQTQPAGAGVLRPDHAGGYGPALCGLQVISAFPLG